MASTSSAKDTRTILGRVAGMVSAWWDRSPGAAAAVVISVAVAALVSISIVTVSALHQPQVATAIADRIADNTREMGEQVARLELTVQTLQTSIVARETEDQQRTRVMADLVAQVARLVEQVDTLTQRVGRLEKPPEDENR